MAADQTTQQTDELLDKYNEIKESQERTLTPAEVEFLLPDDAHLNHKGELKLTGPDVSPKIDVNTITLTERRQKILEKINEGYTAVEIENVGVASNSYVHVTVKKFGWLLEHPAFIDAFIRPNLVEANYVLKDLKNDLECYYADREKAIEMLRLLPHEESKIVDVQTDNEVFPKDENKYGFAGSDNIVDDAKEVTDSEDDNQLTDDGWKSIVAALYRDNQDNLADRVIEDQL